ncbi:hypothetical protein GUITHDRAFT_150899, partial [Guillardia theta CCMP2712]
MSSLTALLLCLAWSSAAVGGGRGRGETCFSFAPATTSLNCFRTMPPLCHPRKHALESWDTETRKVRLQHRNGPATNVPSLRMGSDGALERIIIDKEREVMVIFPVAPAVKKESVKFQMGRNSIFLSVDESTLLDGDLWNQANLDLSYWEFDSYQQHERAIVLHVAKIGNMAWPVLLAKEYDPKTMVDRNATMTPEKRKATPEELKLIRDAYWHQVNSG